MSFPEAVVQGEEIESDDERNPKYGQEDYQGTVFSGEAPESDDEILAFSSVKLGNAQEATEVYKLSPTRYVYQDPFEGKSVLQKLLVDRNNLFWHHLNQTVQNFVVTASREILAAEELLIQSQLKIQAASRSIQQANDTADQILTKCENILSSDFLPDIKIPIKDTETV